MRAACWLASSCPTLLDLHRMTWDYSRGVSTFVFSLASSLVIAQM
jgi:hypothetical protein